VFFDRSEVMIAEPAVETDPVGDTA
jgi:hypothetical protein